MWECKDKGAGEGSLQFDASRWRWDSPLYIRLSLYFREEDWFGRLCWKDVRTWRNEWRKDVRRAEWKLKVQWIIVNLTFICEYAINERTHQQILSKVISSFARRNQEYQDCNKHTKNHI